MVLELFLMWHCVDVADCTNDGDLSNITATYIGIIAGFVLGGIISWLIYNRQEKTAVQQQKMLDNIQKLEKNMNRF